MEPAYSHFTYTYLVYLHDRDWLLSLYVELFTLRLAYLSCFLQNLYDVSIHSLSDV